MISVVLPVYNVEKYLIKCINSILNQSFTDFELIIINDGSTDNSLNICKEFAQRDERITLINQQNGGLSEARNSGIKIATKPYITFIDSDDWVKKTYLEDLYTLITENNADISICEYLVEYESLNKENKPRKNDNKITEYSRSEALSLLFKDKELQNYAWGKLYKTTFFNDISYPKGRYYEDIYTTYKLFNKANKIVKINKELIHYLQRNNNITSSYTNSEKKNIDLYDAFLEQLNFIRSNEQNISDIINVKFSLAMCFYRLKKQDIFTYKLESNLFKERDIDKQMRILLEEVPLLRKNKLFLLKYNLSIKKPMLFLKYLELTREKI